jgi:hypothetical protein
MESCNRTDEGEKKQSSLLFTLEVPSKPSLMIFACLAIWVVILLGVWLWSFSLPLKFYIFSVLLVAFILLPATCSLTEKYKWKKWDVDLYKGFISMTSIFHGSRIIWLGEISPESVYVNQARLWFKENDEWRSIGPVTLPHQFMDEFRKAVQAASLALSSKKFSFATFLESQPPSLPRIQDWKKKPDGEIYCCHKENGLLLQAQFEVSSVKWNILKSDMSKEAWKHFESEYGLVSCTS